MREDAVGFQCVECVAEGNRSVREARTVFGGKLIAKPYVTWTLLGLVAVVFVAQVVSAGSLGLVATQYDPLVGQFGMWGAAVIIGDQWYRLITGAFLHGGVMHLLFNGFALYILGPQLENWLGHLRYAALWLISALGGSVLGLLLQPGVMSVGASGAIFGLFGATFVLGRRLRLDTRFILGLLVANLLITFLVPGISWTAHIGGLVSGLVLGVVYAYLPPRRDSTRPWAPAAWHVGLTAGYMVVLAVAAVLGTVLR
ncbi:membrane associated rhomboid family serine protease [Thermobifida halotolerans]